MNDSVRLCYTHLYINIQLYTPVHLKSGKIHKKGFEKRAPCQMTVPAGSCTGEDMYSYALLCTLLNIDHIHRCSNCIMGEYSGRLSKVEYSLYQSKMYCFKYYK